MKLPSMRLTIVFIAGLVLGIVLGRFALFMPFRPFPHRGPPTPEMMLERLVRDLDLDESQRDKARPIVLELDSKFKMLRTEADPKIENAITEAASKAENFLRENQKKKLQELLVKFRERRNSFRSPGPPPPPEP